MTKKRRKREGEIISFGTRDICLYCGKEMEQKYEEYTPYFECDCPDAVKERKIRAQIFELERQIPRPKFEIIEAQVLCKLNDR